MKTADFKAMHETTDEFAVQRIPINHPNQPKNDAWSLRQCPTGLRRCRIVQLRAPWKEPFTLGCGDQVHHRERRNGILIEFEMPAKAPKGAKTASKRPQSPRTYWSNKDHTEVVKRDGKTYVQMIVGVASIVAPWGEYEMIEAEREKERAKQQAQTDRFNAAAEALGVRPWRQQHYDINEMGGKYERPEGASRYDHQVDCLVLPIGQAERIAKLLAEQ